MSAPTNQELSAMVERLDGIFVGMLTDDEITQLNDAVARGLARRSYEGVAGFMGLAKIRAVGVDAQEDGERDE